MSKDFVTGSISIFEAWSLASQALVSALHKGRVWKKAFIVSAMINVLLVMYLVIASFGGGGR